MLTDEQIIKFQRLWENRFHEPISRDQAVLHGMNLIRLIQIVLKDDSSSDFSVGPIVSKPDVLK